jgi:hypothetical protein
MAMPVDLVAVVNGVTSAVDAPIFTVAAGAG